MVNGKIVADFSNKEHKEAEIQSCDLFVGVGIRKGTVIFEGISPVHFQILRIGGEGLEGNEALDLAVDGIITVISRMTNNPLETLSKLAEQAEQETRRELCKKWQKKFKEMLRWRPFE